MASDLPDFGFDTSMAMAKVLVTYMNDASAVRARLKDDFNYPPTVDTIAKLREEHLASLEAPEEAPHKAFEGYYPCEIAHKMEWINKRFVEALERERALSAEVARSLGVLNSSLLTNTSLVDKAYEQEVENARRLQERRP